MKEPLSVGIIGVGAIAPSHAEGIRHISGLKLVSAAGQDQEQCRAFSWQCGCQPYSDWRKMITDGLDIAVVALPHFLHLEAAVTALEAGCHVLLEKPAAVNLSQCRALSEAAHRSRRRVMMADLAYHLPGIVMARQLVASGRMGRFIMGGIVNYRFYFAEERPAWFLEKEQAGGGLLLNLGVHRMAAIRSVLGGEECVVKASVGFFRPGCEVEGRDDLPRLSGRIGHHTGGMRVSGASPTPDVRNASHL
ncbi:MAG: Gfo/Idh/MocA family oxidoreductase [Candidatus Latescibacterota bacterium]